MDVFRYGCQVTIIAIKSDRDTKIAIFIRMALELGLNKDIDLKEDGKRTMSVDRWIEIEVQRRVFWAVFTLDK